MFRCTGFVDTLWISVSQYCVRKRERGTVFYISFTRDLYFFRPSLIFQKQANLVLVCMFVRTYVNSKQPTHLYRARLGLRKWIASKPSRFLSLSKFPREKLPYSVPFIYMRICALIQLNNTIFSHNGRGKFRPHTTLGFVEISLGFWSNIGPPF